MEDLRAEEDPGPAVLAAALATFISARQDKPHCLALRVDGVRDLRRRYGKALVVVDQLAEVLLFLLLLLYALFDLFELINEELLALMLLLGAH